MNASRDVAGLFEDIAPQLWRAVYAYAGGRRAVADDAVAEAFARLIESDGAVRQPFPWLYRIAFRVAAAEIRRDDRPIEDRADFADVANPVDASVDSLAHLLGALRRLSPSQRAAVFLHYQADMPTREVARVMGTSVAAVKVHLHRGRARLRTLLGTEEVPDD